jgi:hypothetical protein
MWRFDDRRNIQTKLALERAILLPDTIEILTSAAVKA